MNTVWFLEYAFVVDFRAVDLDPPESAFHIHVSSVADPGCLCRIPDLNFAISDPGSR